METPQCRLCLGRDNLVHVFAQKVAANMSQIIYAASGVQILRTDQITQMICSTCCQITLKIFKFRNTSIKNDQDLKAKRLDLSVAELLGNTSSHSSTKNTSLNVSNFINVSRCDTPKSTATSVSSNEPVRTPTSVKKARPLIPKKYQHAHLSLKNILRQHPRIDLPEDLPLDAHYGPYITLLADEVDEWFKERGYTTSEIEGFKQEALYQNLPRAKLSPSIKENEVIRKPIQAEGRLKQRIPSSAEEPCKKNIQVVKNDPRNSVSNLKRLSSDNIEQVNQSAVFKKIKMNTSYDVVKDTNTTTISKAQISTASPKINLNDAKPQTEQSTTSNILSNLLSKESSFAKEAITLQSMLATSESITLKSQVPSETHPSNKLTESNTGVFVPTRNEEDNGEKSNLDNRLVEDANKQISLDSEKTLAMETPHWGSMSNTDNDSIGIDADNSRMSFSSNCSSFNPIEDKEKDYFRSLQLEPKSSTDENQPDFSLLSSNKYSQLHFCRICDSYHASQKELKAHERNQHTRCPFCRSKFKNLEIRNDHVKYSCGMNLVSQKILNIPLERVDEDKTIRRQYANAFAEVNLIESTPESENELNVASDSPNTTLTEINNVVGKPNDANSEELQKQQHSLEHLKLAAQTLEKPTPVVSLEKKVLTKTIETTKKRKIKEKFKENDQILAMQEIEKYIKAVETITTDDDVTEEKRIKSTKKSKNTNVREVSINSGDVICISDEESDAVGGDGSSRISKSSTSTNETSVSTTVTTTVAAPTKTSTAATLTNKTKQTNIKAKILHNINMLDKVKNVSDDVEVINLVKRLLTHRKITSEGGDSDHWEIDNPIVDGASPKVKIFKNLRKQLHNFKIPVVISFGNKISAEYKPVKPVPETKISDLWGSMVPQELKKFIKPTPIQSTSTTKSFMTKAPTTGKLIVQQAGVGTSQNHVPTSNSLLITSKSSTKSVGQTYNILNGTTVPNGFTIILPPILTASTSLPHTQGPLPVIQSVTSLDESSRDNVTQTSDQVTPTPAAVPSFKVVKPVNGQLQLVRTDDSKVSSTVSKTSASSSEPTVEETSPAQPSLRVKQFGIF